MASRFRVLNIVDDFAREYVLKIVKLRESCFDLHWFASNEENRSAIDDWHHHYNHVSPH